MPEGIDGSPWWARWASGLVTQLGLGWTQGLVFQHLEILGPWIVAFVAFCQLIAGATMVFGPRDAAKLAVSVGEAWRAAKASRASKAPGKTAPPSDPAP